MKKRTLLFVINIIAIVVAMFLQNKAVIYPELEQYIQPGLFLIAALSMVLMRIKDNAFKYLLISSLVFFSISMYLFFTRDQYESWFSLAIFSVISAYLLLLLANRRRNFDNHEPSIMRTKPWVSGLFMVSAYWLFKELDSSLASKKIAVIVLIAMSVIVALVTVERLNQVNVKSAWTMMIAVVLLMFSHGVMLHSLYHSHSDILVLGTTAAVGLSSLLMFWSLTEYDNMEIG